jgi:hypothetical protein
MFQFNQVKKRPRKKIKRSEEIKSIPYASQVLTKEQFQELESHVFQRNKEMAGLFYQP